jgi:branched-chain amino acid transport system substrate-binding protein
MKRLIAALVMTTSLVFAGGAPAQTMDKVVKVGSLGDQSGLYADIGGPGSTVAAQMAIEDSGLLAKGWACYGLLVMTALKLLWDGVSGYLG